MIITQLDNNNDSDPIVFIRKLLVKNNIDLMFNGFINIGNNPNIINSSILETLAIFLLKLNNIKVYKHAKGIMIELSKYNLFIEETSMNQLKDIKISIRLDYLPNINAIITDRDIEFKFFKFSKYLSTIMSSEFAQQVIDLLTKTSKFLQDIESAQNQIIPILIIFLQVISQIDKDINIQSNTYELTDDHSIYKLDGINNTKIKHIYSLSVKEKEYEWKVSILESDKYIVRFEFKDIQDNWCDLYIYKNKSI